MNSFIEELKNTDTEFVEFFKVFNEDVINQTKNIINDKTRVMATIATLLGCEGIETYKDTLADFLKELTPLEMKETLYQAVAYLGIGRVYPFIKFTNEYFKEHNIEFPKQTEIDTDAHLKKGVQAQVDIFGDGMKEFYKSGAEEVRHINKWLAQNCFGDYYTRTGLDYKQREMITFCIISSQGGCEPQLTAHAMANLRVGNSKEFLINIVSSMIPFIGYPRSLNAISCINNAYKTFSERK